MQNSRQNVYFCANGSFCTKPQKGVFFAFWYSVIRAATPASRRIGSFLRCGP